MKHAKDAFSVFVLIAILSTFLSTLGSHAISAQAAEMPDVIQSFPVDFKFVFSIDVKKTVASPLYQQFFSKQADSLKTRYLSIFEEIGLDPERDLDHIYGAGRSGDDGGNDTIVIVSGTFNRNAITDVIVRRPRLSETTHGKFRIFTVIEKQDEKSIEKSIVFLNDRKVVIGDVAVIENFLDIHEKKKPGIMSDSKMAALLKNIKFEEMIWFAGDATTAIKNFPAKSPLEQMGLNMATSISSVAGSLDFANAFNGTIMAIAINAAAAEKMTETLRVLMDIARLSGEKNVQAKLLLDGFRLAREADRITVQLHYPLNFFEQLEKIGPKSLLEGIGKEGE